MDETEVDEVEAFTGDEAGASLTAPRKHEEKVGVEADKP